MNICHMGWVLRSRWKQRKAEVKEGCSCDGSKEKPRGTHKEKRKVGLQLPDFCLSDGKGFYIILEALGNMVGYK